MSDEQQHIAITSESLKGLSPLFYTPAGEALLKLLMQMVGIERVNHLYAQSAHLKGWAFVDSTLHNLGITYHVHHIERIEQLTTQRFITVSNHPFGALDGLILIHLMASYYPQYRVMVNYILSLIPSLDDQFIAVDPSTNNRKVTREGLKQTFDHLAQGHPLGFFPAGAVSRLNRHLRIEDRVWQPSVARLIQQLKAPVVPIYFSGSNSTLFHLLGLLGWRVRTLRMPHEIFNKQQQPLSITIGQPIPVAQQQQYSSAKLLAHYLREETYRLKRG